MSGFRNPRSVSEAERSREQVENHRTICTQVLFQSTTAELGFFHFLEIVTGCLVPFHRRRSPFAENRFQQGR
jgi:hypothetical protein